MNVNTYNGINKLSRIVELENESEREISYERGGALLCVAIVTLAVLMMIF